MTKSLNSRPPLPGIRHPGSTLYGDEVRGNRMGDTSLPTTTQIGFGLGARYLPLESPDRGAACLYRERRFPGALVGEEGLRSATMILKGGKIK